MSPNSKRLFYFLVGFIFTSNITQSPADIGPRDNGDIFVSNNENTSMEANTQNGIDFDGAIASCNETFSIPVDNLVEFNNTGKLPNDVDKTGPCFIRCFYETTGLIDDWQLNAEKIRQYMWPATGDSIPVCQAAGKNETNACVRVYEIAKCLMIRALVDAQNKPMV